MVSSQTPRKDLGTEKTGLKLPVTAACCRVAQLSRTPGSQDLANGCDWSILGCQPFESLLPGHSPKVTGFIVATNQPSGDTASRWASPSLQAAPLSISIYVTWASLFVWRHHTLFIHRRGRATPALRHLQPLISPKIHHGRPPQAGIPCSGPAHPLRHSLPNPSSNYPRHQGCHAKGMLFLRFLLPMAPN
jgi:hypothetical protein